MKNVLVLSSSPRCDGVSEMLADTFIEGAKSMGNTVNKFELATMHIRPCITCNTCFSKNVACSMGDDFNTLAPYILNADVIVLAMPLYWYSFPASMKLVIDKLYSFVVSKQNLSDKEVYLLSVADEGYLSSFDPLISTYNKILSHLGWVDSGKVLVLHSSKIEDFKSSKYYLEALNLGKSV